MTQGGHSVRYAQSRPVADEKPGMRIFEHVKDFNWRYALGELTLIVAGVTIALAVNSWYEDQIDLATEIEYIDRLHAALSADISTFSSFEKILDTKANMLKALSTETVSSLLSIGADDLMRDLNFSAFKALPASNSTIIEELQNTGNLALLSDSSVRDALAQYYSGYKLMSGILAEPGGRYREILRSSLSGNAAHYWWIDGQSIDVNELRSGLEKMLSHPDIEAAINSELFYTADMKFYLRRYRTMAIELRNILEAMR
jgi:hypothetical protein